VDRCVTGAGLRIVHADERRRGGVLSLTLYAAAPR
jgi:hypothetical protein